MRSVSFDDATIELDAPADDDVEPDGPAYAFDGYEIVQSEKVALVRVSTARAAGGS